MSAGHHSSTLVLTEAIRLAISSLRHLALSLERALERFADSGENPPSSLRPGSETASSAWDLLDDPELGFEAQPVARGDLRSYDQVAREIPPVPQSCLELCARLGQTPEDSRIRAKRAWEAGFWAKAAAAGEVPTPRPTPKLESVRNSVYIVLRAPGIQHPVRVSSAREYFKLVPDFSGDSLSHGFGSLAEARVYCSAFGIPLPAEQ